VCRSKKEDWLPKKERNQRRPGRRRSQEDLDDTGELHVRAQCHLSLFFLCGLQNCLIRDLVQLVTTTLIGDSTGWFMGLNCPFPWGFKIKY